MVKIPLDERDGLNDSNAGICPTNLYGIDTDVCGSDLLQRHKVIHLPPECSPCPYGTRSISTGAHSWVGSRGDPDKARLVVVAEAPGEEERWKGMPTVGATGYHLWKAIAPEWEDWQNSTPPEVYMCNVRKCLPPMKESTKAQRDSIKLCSHNWLYSELKSCKEARCVLLLGGDALYATMGLNGISEMIGACWNRQEVEAISQRDWLPPKCHTVVLSLHPAAAMRGARWMLSTLRAIMARGREWAGKEYGPGHVLGYRPILDGSYDRLDGLSFHFNPHPDLLMDALEKADGPTAIDIETPRKDSNNILMVGAAPTATSAYVCEWREPYCSLYKAYLEDAGKVCVGHNFYYDAKAFYNNGIKVRAKVYDTITMGSCLWPPRGERKLKGEAKQKKEVKVQWLGLQLSVLRCFNGIAPWKSLEERWIQNFYQAAFGHRFSSWQFPFLYNGLDCLYTRQLLEAEREMMEIV